MYKIIWKGKVTELREAKDWCDNAGIKYATSYKEDYRSSDIGFLPGDMVNRLSHYFAFSHEMDAATFCMLFGGKINYVSGQRPIVGSDRYHT